MAAEDALQGAPSPRASILRQLRDGSCLELARMHLALELPVFPPTY
eukprot:CAMPEP_0194766760 /NCGR_PEP_ID=MMETSP0323_2-20130528/32921_1 /TAXON_ID=2866 ORGANISM="Crypthecodinium cohnii, Strain Seligo" /NCGR_SAMPLE_ID=MMETSP0323_2 /ASSEMBLY_ACC=CAM_ASM_000346 /LENGTH=45 /DNA_ID= /DNA_START= /DNA_END= /DNA_ORIENTATION=